MISIRVPVGGKQSRVTMRKIIVKGPSYRVITDIHVLLLNTGKTIYRKVIDE